MLREEGKALTKKNKQNKKAERLGEGSAYKIFAVQVSHLNSQNPHKFHISSMHLLYFSAEVRIPRIPRPDNLLSIPTNYIENLSQTRQDAKTNNP